MIDHEQVILLLLTAKFCSEVSDINTKLIKTQFSLQQSILKNILQVEKHFKTLEKLLTFEPNISEYNLFSDTFIYRRFKCRNTFVQKFIYTDKIYFNPLCLYLISWRENQSGIPDCYWCFWLNFPRAAELHLVKWRTYFSLISLGDTSLLYFKLFFENMSVPKTYGASPQIF